MAKETVKEENVTVNKVEETKVDQEAEAKETKPKYKKKRRKVKGFKKKVVKLAKKVAPYTGAFVAGAGAAVGALLVMSRPDNAKDQPYLEKDEDLTLVDDFIDGEAEIVDAE